VAKVKAKTKRGAVKRFKMTKSGKIKRHKAYKSHMLSSKSRKRKRNLRKSTLVSASDIRRVRAMITA
jgi:large subunit ribosomal protein L35